MKKIKFYLQKENEGLSSMANAIFIANDLDHFHPLILFQGLHELRVLEKENLNNNTLYCRYISYFKSSFKHSKSYSIFALSIQQNLVFPLTRNQQKRVILNKLAANFSFAHQPYKAGYRQRTFLHTDFPQHTNIF